MLLITNTEEPIDYTTFFLEVSTEYSPNSDYLEIEISVCGTEDFYKLPVNIAEVQILRGKGDQYLTVDLKKFILTSDYALGFVWGVNFNRF